MSEQHTELSKRNALVTGAGAGHGQAIALALADSGASVAVCDINIERADRTREQIHERGGRAIALQADISNRFQAANMIETARDAFGKIHILVNAAGVFHPEAMLSIDEWNWRRQLEMNITGVFFCLQLAGRVMADEGGGVIINLASAIGLGSTLPSGIGYVASQAAVLAMTRQAARELAPHGILVNAIATGGAPPEDAQRADPIGALKLDGRSVGDVAVYLCSEEAAALTGQVLVVKDSNSAD